MPDNVPEFAFDEAVRLGAVFDAADTGLLLIDLESLRVLAANPVLERMFGVASGKLIGVDYLSLMTDESRIDSLRQTTLLLERRFTSYRGQRHFCRPDGGDFWAEVGASLFLDPKSDRMIGIGVIRDITQQRRRETEIETANVRLQEQAERFALLAADLEVAKGVADDARMLAESASRAKSEFLANMSHELRTPLNAVIGFAQMMGAELFGKLGNDRYREYCQDILASGNHLLEVINELLDLAKIEAGRMQLEEDEVDFDSILAASMRLVRERATRKQIAISFACEGLPPITGDNRALRQIMLNLLSNAVKFSLPGGQVGVEGTIEPSGAMAIRVIDSGIGIPADEIPRIHEPFSQARNARLTGETGTGLGLSIVKALIELHGGELRIESVLGAGTTVTITIPPERVIRIDDQTAAADLHRAES